jgi:hypothetical protein
VTETESHLIVSDPNGKNQKTITERTMGLWHISHSPSTPTFPTAPRLAVSNSGISYWLCRVLTLPFPVPNTGTSATAKHRALQLRASGDVTDNRCLRSGLSELIPEEEGKETALRRCFARLDEAIDQLLAENQSVAQT